MSLAERSQDFFFLSKLPHPNFRLRIICFVSDQDLDPQDVYFMYDHRWEIETFFGFYKNIVSLSSVRVQGDRGIIGTEFINMLSSVISSRVKKLFLEKGLSQTYSYSQIMSYFEQPKKIRKPDGSWTDCYTVKYIQELKTTLGDLGYMGSFKVFLFDFLNCQVYIFGFCDESIYIGIQNHHP